MNPLKSPAGFNEACRKITTLLFDCDGVMTDGHVVLGDNNLELKFFSAADGIGLNLWKKTGKICGVITGRCSEALTRRARELRFDEVHQGIMTKGEVLADIMKRRNLKAEEIAYIGDDLNDLPVGTRVGLFFAPSNHHASIRPYADYVLTAHGGHGAVREVVDIILSRQGLLDDLIQGFVNGA